MLKIRMQAKNKEFAGKGLAASFINIYKEEGLKGLWRVSNFLLTLKLREEPDNSV